MRAPAGVDATLTPLPVAARLAHPWEPVAPSAFSRDVLAAAADVLLSQKVSLMSLARAHGDALNDTPLAAAIAADAACYRRERDEYETIRRRFMADGIRSMLFKSAGLYPSFQYLSSNLDVIVPDGCAPAARRHLVELGYVELLNVEEPRKCLFRRFPGDGSSFAFHLHEVVGWGVPFLDNEVLWVGARAPEDDPEILIPAPREALLITLAHWFYEDKELSLGNLLLTARAMHDMHVPLAAAAPFAAARGWEEGFWGGAHVFDMAWSRLYGAPFMSDAQREEVNAALRRHSFVRDEVLSHVHYGTRTLASIPFLRNKVVYYRKISRDANRTAFRRVRDITETLLWAVRWKLHIRSQKPLVVSISGCDGSGKTLHVDALRDALDTCDIRYAARWTRGASSRFMAALFSVGRMLTGRRRATDAARSGAGTRSEADRFRARRQSLGRGPARATFAWLYVLDLLPACVFRPRILSCFGYVVVLDRSVIDAVVDYTLYTGDALDALPWPVRFLERASVRPRVEIVLDVSPGEALRRKPEEGDAEHLSAARDVYLELACRRGSRVVSTEADVAGVKRRITSEVLDAFYRDYGTALNGLLWSNPSQLNPRPGVR